MSSLVTDGIVSESTIIVTLSPPTTGCSRLNHQAFVARSHKNEFYGRMSIPDPHKLLAQLLSSSPVLEAPGVNAAADILSRISWRGFRDDSKSAAMFSFSGSHLQVDITLIVHKGSLFTHLWNPYGRVDDEYSAVLEFATAPGRESSKLLWRVSGFDFTNKRVFDCKVNWMLMRALQRECDIPEVGTQCMAKLLVHLLLNIPAYMRHGYCYPPMPATLM